MLLLQFTKLHIDNSAADSNFLRVWNFVYLCPRKSCPPFNRSCCNTQQGARVFPDDWNINKTIGSLLKITKPINQIVLPSSPHIFFSCFMAITMTSFVELLVDTTDGTDLGQGNISTEQENCLSFLEIYLQSQSILWVTFVFAPSLLCTEHWQCHKDTLQPRADASTTLNQLLSFSN